jgi:hypothetical protein
MKESEEIMPGFPMDRGSIKIKNNTAEPYTVVEMGGTIIAPGAEIDMMDEAVPGHYGDYEAAHRLVSELVTAKLRQDVVAGDLVVTLDQPPRI